MRAINCMLTIAFLFSLMSPTQGLGSTELAKVNGKVITLEYFNKKYSENLKYFQFRRPTKKNVLDDMIKRELGIQEAKRLKLDRDPGVIALLGAHEQQRLSWRMALQVLTRGTLGPR